MQIKTNIAPGERKRIVVHVRGKKFYLELKAGKLIDYAKSSRRDQATPYTLSDR